MINSAGESGAARWKRQVQHYHDLYGLMAYNAEAPNGIEETSIKCSVYLIEARKLFIDLTFAAPEAYKKHGKDIDAFVKEHSKEVLTLSF